MVSEPIKDLFNHPLLSRIVPKTENEIVNNKFDTIQFSKYQAGSEMYARFF